MRHAISADMHGFGRLIRLALGHADLVDLVSGLLHSLAGRWQIPPADLSADGLRMGGSGSPVRASPGSGSGSGGFASAMQNTQSLGGYTRRSRERARCTCRISVLGQAVLYMELFDHI